MKNYNITIDYESLTEDKRLQMPNVNAMNLWQNVNICGIYSSLEEAFEFCWSSFADEHNTFNTKIELEESKIFL